MPGQESAPKHCCINRGSNDRENREEALAAISLLSFSLIISSLYFALPASWLLSQKQKVTSLTEYYYFGPDFINVNPLDPGVWAETPQSLE